MDPETASGGEVEIERIPTRIIEGRSKGLVPVFDFLQTTKYQKTRYEFSDIFPLASFDESFSSLCSKCLHSFCFSSPYLRAVSHVLTLV